MKIANPRLIRLAGLTAGATIERGDGELIIPPIIQPIIRLVAPVRTIIGSGTYPAENKDDSFLKDEELVKVGALGATNQPLVSLKKGAWHLNAMVVGAFSGTLNMAKSAGIALVDSVAGNTWFIAKFPFATTDSFIQDRDLYITTDTDGWQLTLVSSATIAADNLYIATSISMSKVL